MKLPRHPSVYASALAATGFVLMLALREMGLLQPLELALYDRLLASRAVAAGPQQRVALVGANEEDITALGWPSSDATLAKLLGAVLAQGPRAVGLDIYRDAPRPPGEKAFARLLQREEKLVVVRKIGSPGEPGVPPPPGLEGSDKVGFADVSADPGGVVRRGLLFLDENESTQHSFPLRLALLYLKAEGIAPAAGDDPAHMRLGKTSIPPFEENDGAYVGADAGGYQFLLDYAGGPVPFARYSFGDVLAGRAPPDAFKDRVVIVGVTAPSVKDFFETPFSRDEASPTVHGITLHAHVVGQLLRMAIDGSKPVRVFPEWAELAWLALWCALGAFAGLKAQRLGRFAFLAVAGIAANILVVWIASGQSAWLPLFPQTFGWLAVLALVTAWSLHLERAERSQLMGIFSRYIGGDLAADVWARREEFLEPGGRPRPQRLTCTVLFSDIKGFTAVSEKLDAAGLMQWLNSYMEAMASLVMKHGGVVDKFIGDAVMAVFGVPVSKDREGIRGDARAAARCALDMRAGLRRFNEEWTAKGLPAIGIRVGIYTGELISGSLGSADRMEYTVIGDTVNTASRLESFKLAPGETPPEALAEEADGACRILVGDSTAAHLNRKFILTRVGEVLLKGKETPVIVYSLVGKAGA